MVSNLDALKAGVSVCKVCVPRRNLGQRKLILGSKVNFVLSKIASFSLKTVQINIKFIPNLRIKGISNCNFFEINTH